MHPKGPATGQIDQGFPWSSSVLEQVPDGDQIPRCSAHFSCSHHNLKNFRTNAALPTLPNFFQNIAHLEELCVCFIDWQKAFDRVNWTKLMQILKRIGIDWRERSLISKLYMEQKVKVRLKGQIEVTRRRRRRRKKLLDDLKDRRGYCQLKEEALYRTMWRNRFGRGFGPVV